MLSRKKSKNEASKPAEVQGKYVKKETSPLLRSESLFSQYDYQNLQKNK